MLILGESLALHLVSISSYQQLMGRHIIFYKMGKKGKNKNQPKQIPTQQQSQTSTAQIPEQQIEPLQQKKSHQANHHLHHIKHNQHTHRQAKSTTQGKGKYFTWEEIAKHDYKDDLWVVIEDGVFDLTKMVEKHPGGSKVIAQRAGKKADKAFLHGNHPPKVMDSKLPHFRVGSVAQQSMIESWQREEKTGKMDSFIAITLSLLIIGFIAYMVV